MFKALLLTQENKQTRAALTDLDDSQLPEGEVTVRIEYSTLNYKDALAVTGRGAIVRTWPMVPGIDLAGTVEASSDPAWKSGDPVVVTGWGLGETHWGGLAQLARVKGDPAESRLVVAAARGLQRAAVDGHRHRRLHRRAVRDGPATPWAAAR